MGGEFDSKTRVQPRRPTRRATLSAYLEQGRSAPAIAPGNGARTDAAPQVMPDAGKAPLIGGATSRTTAEFGPVPVQMSASAPVQLDSGAVRETAAKGVSGSGGPLPHRATIEDLFGRHDVSGIKAHVGGEPATASRAIGAEAYAMGDNVAFASAPSLHTAAHEAAHVVQQRGGVRLKGGVGESRDRYEQHADAVADAVVQGKSPEGLLDGYPGGSGGDATGVQRQEATDPAAPAPADPEAASAVDAPAPEPATKLTPDDVAEWIIRRPDIRDDILEWAERVGGAAYVRNVLAAVQRNGRDRSTTQPSTAMAAASTGAPTAPPASGANQQAMARTSHAPTSDRETFPTPIKPTPPPEHAVAPPPVSKPAPAIAANPNDESLAVMAAQLHNPQAAKIVTDLAALTAQAKAVPVDRARKELKGEARENFVAAIGVMRAQVNALAATDPQTVAFRTAVNHKLEELSPYHAQVNIRTIETGAYTTCNVTSLAMSLETIGKNADSYKVSKRPQIVAVARQYRSDIAKATLASHGTEPVWESLRGLRLPDFMELAAIANTLHSAEPTEAEIKQAGVYAAVTKTRLDFLAAIAADFGAHASPHTTQFGGHANDLECCRAGLMMAIKAG